MPVEKCFATAAQATKVSDPDTLPVPDVSWQGASNPTHCLYSAMNIMPTERSAIALQHLHDYACMPEWRNSICHVWQ